MAPVRKPFETFGGLILMGLGGLFLADEFLNINMTGSIWPLALIGFGLYLLLGKRSDKSGGTS